MVDTVLDISPSVQDVLVTNDIPQYVRELYPNFVQFLKGYYEWLELEGNPYERIKNHLDYEAFEKSLDLYVKAMESEYLNEIPIEAISNPQFFIEWSRKFNLAKGAKESYQFLFKLLFGEQTTDIYLPKDNILRTSDGVWISGQNVMLVTNNGNPDALIYKQIVQKREIYAGHYETATAIVDSYTISYVNEFNIVQLVLTNIEGTFLAGYPITDADGNNSVWPIPSIVGFDITNGGENFAVNTPVELNSSDWNGTFQQTYVVSETGKIDTQLTMSANKSLVSIVINSQTLDPSKYDFDGQFLTSTSFVIGLSVQVTFSNAYSGKFTISAVDSTGKVLKINVLENPIAISGTSIPLTFSSTLASDLDAKAIVGVVRPLPGYYSGDKGQLSTDMYLEDSNYYQEYSYVIKTSQDIQKYADLVKNVLHPAGFKMFGNILLIDILKDIIAVPDNAFTINVQGQTLQLLASALYSLDGNYLFIAKTNGGFMSPRVYKGTEWDASYVNSVSGYALQDKSWERTYDENGNPVVVSVKGWMTWQPLSDADVRQPQDYFSHDEYNFLYVESSFVETVDMNTTDFLNTYIDTYGAVGYITDQYWEDGYDIDQSDSSN